MSFIELATRLAPADLIQHLNKHLELRMYVVGHNITAADITLLVHLLEHFVRDIQKLFININVVYSKHCKIMRSFKCPMLSDGSTMCSTYPACSSKFSSTICLWASLTRMCKLPQRLSWRSWARVKQVKEPLLILKKKVKQQQQLKEETRNLPNNRKKEKNNLKEEPPQLKTSL